eukprot:TRINITY_DN4181_c0_g1_i2.p1 TRINITY_DN4181_c0_g1~~TRINITY_DN4181_c0_g1_i2.p1  ORF type:complete len:400 (-),score=81.53 TRINITY_DN4181_c0_g1_i2:459-1571(-)
MDTNKRKERERELEDIRSNVEDVDGEKLKKKQRLEKLKAWRLHQSKQDEDPKQSHIKDGNAGVQHTWMPWEDCAEAVQAGDPQRDIPAEIAYRRACAGIKEQEMKSRLKPIEGEEDDPLDAFMKDEIAPEIKAREAEEAERLAQERQQVLKEQQSRGDKPNGNKKIPKYLQESDSDEEADLEMEIPMNKVKLLIGPGGTKIQEIQKKARCRIQVQKTEADLNKAFGSGMMNYIPEHRLAGKEASQRHSIVQIFGSGRSVQLAQRLINEAIENKDQKQRNRQREYEKKRDEKRRNRQLFYLRHTKDYQILGVMVGSSREEVKKAYRDLAKKWHPDKHPENKEEAKQKFQEIQMAFDRLMRHDEDEKIEQLQ